MFVIVRANDVIAVSDDRRIADADGGARHKEGARIRCSISRSRSQRNRPSSSFQSHQSHRSRRRCCC